MVTVVVEGTGTFTVVVPCPYCAGVVTVVEEPVVDGTEEGALITVVGCVFY